MSSSCTREARLAFDNAVSLKAADVNFIFAVFISTAKSLGSRSVIRQKLIDYHKGSVSFIELSSFTAPKYADGAAVINHLRGASRHLADGSLITAWGDNSLLLKYSKKPSGLYYQRSEGSGSSVIVVSDILDDGKKIGYDVCIFDGGVIFKNIPNELKRIEIISRPTVEPAENDLTRIVNLEEKSLALAGDANSDIFFSAGRNAIKIVIVYTSCLFVFITLLSYFTFFRFVQRLIGDYNAINLKLKNSLNEREVLLKEVHHRIKNNMNTVAGVLYLQSASLKEPAAVAAVKDARNRVLSMMVLYDKLYCSTDYNEISFKDYFSRLIDEIVDNFPNKESVKIEKNMEDFLIDAVKTSHLGILINELLTNIMKYAFSGRTRGVITVSSSAVNNHAIIVIADDGIGMSELADVGSSEGFGLQLVELMTKSLHGTMKVERMKGTKFTLDFDL